MALLMLVRIIHDEDVVLNFEIILLAWRNDWLMPVTIVSNLYWLLAIRTNACISHLGEKLLSFGVRKHLV